MRLLVGEWIFSEVEKEMLSNCNLKWQAPSINIKSKIRWIWDIYIWLCCFFCVCWMSTKSPETYFKHTPVCHLSPQFCITPPTHMSWIALNRQLSQRNAEVAQNKVSSYQLILWTKGRTSNRRGGLVCVTQHYSHSVEWEINGEKEWVSNIVYST